MEAEEAEEEGEELHGAATASAADGSSGVPSWEEVVMAETAASLRPPRARSVERPRVVKAKGQRSPKAADHRPAAAATPGNDAFIPQAIYRKEFVLYWIEDAWGRA